ncbi:bifunctional transcriptional activator/DNA repair enzyme AdaA [Jeotgalibacillus campisalis]|uniref:methylated-DNA--[protein]-cysteine S-methyltransferase n=1 Tax=Jeotgalibacillus campisalis TaxID=220754 RepID=A0A0C2W3F4_9BACL|nr:trifunctional transcriptional activator/DNA repair protein Ada/methylated-DNA--[protein]-cysteine S-methyltransferase [Jeotgalibacillus campisalis]KIL51156.1 6-O-methylguanine DNA methyltransferase [Jeotgalibacillus campisalis]
METLERKSEFYQALIEKNSEYEGIFYVGVKTTGVFCRPTCPARKPKFENCEFYQTAKEALLASFRPCKRCRPLSHPNQVSEVVARLVEAVELNPEKRWKDYHFREMEVDESTARRQFKKRFGMTFVEYARSRRMGIAMKQLRCGEAVIDAQLAAGYESSSGFRDAFSRIMGAPPALADNKNMFKAAWIDTKLGPMIAIADEKALWLLEFVDRRGLEREVEKLRTKTKSAVIPGSNSILQSVEKELQEYFDGKRTEFKTPIRLIGSDFQKSVWQKLRVIPYGETKSYFDIASSLGKPTAFRAVALANGANQLAIIIPCHRVIRLNGNLGGYGGGISRKQWMLEFEKKNK